MKTYKQLMSIFPADSLLNAAESAREHVWLECNGELIGIRSVAIVGMREAVPGVELVKFCCPHCGSTHESLRFLPLADSADTVRPLPADEPRTERACRHRSKCVEQWETFCHR